MVSRGGWVLERVPLGLAGLAAAALIGPLAATVTSASVAVPAAVPRAECGPGSAPETAQQGRVPAADYASGRADEPYTCNTEVVGRHGTTGGFKVHRYVDADGTECAFYDSTLFFPFDLDAQASEGLGVRVLDMTDPSTPTLTATLTTPAMLSPHESLVLNQERGLLAAVAGNAATYPGQLDIYDVSQDCTQPALLTSAPVAFVGHESGFAPDGNTFYASSLFTSTFTAVDVSDPRAPVTIWTTQLNSHGVNISDDGTRAYLTPVEMGTGPFVTGEFDSGITILDVSAIQDRATDPRPEVVSQLTWPTASIAQAAIPVTIDGTPYLVEVDEFVHVDDFDDMSASVPGAARLIDISDETAPRVVSDLRLEVHDPAVRNSDGVLDDPGADRPYQGYAGHYCAVPTPVDPPIVACSMILSGLRVFDITDPLAPREIAYFNAPANPSAAFVNPEGAPYAMSAPAFVPERNEIWYADTASGFWAVRLTNGVWPSSSTDTLPSTPPTAPTAPPAAGPDLPATGGNGVWWGLGLLATSLTTLLAPGLVGRGPARRSTARGVR